MTKKLKQYHILSLSGGKDSTALALFIKENMLHIHKRIEYVFYDTGLDLKETYDYLNKIEVFLDKSVTYVKPEQSFDDIFDKGGMLPSPFARWCTVELKVKPSIKFLKDKIKNEGEGIINLYVGIRADEKYRKGVELKSIFEQTFVKPCYPLIENGITKQDVHDILVNSGIGYPDYYNWRDRNGCYLCFFQSPYDWIKLYENHPDLFQKAMDYEKRANKGHSVRFGLNMQMPLCDMIKPENIKKNQRKV